MSDQDDGFMAVSCRSSTDQVVLVSILAVPLSVLLVAPVFGAFGRAAITVGFVLAEALALYVGYGVLTRVANPIAHEILVSD